MPKALGSGKSLSSDALIKHNIPYFCLNYTKSVEYRLHIRRGTHARGTHAKGGINNQSLITGFSIRFIQQALIKDFIKISGHSRSPLPCSLNQSFSLNQAVLPRTPEELSPILSARCEVTPVPRSLAKP